jgi:hypothetical protein
VLNCHGLVDSADPNSKFVGFDLGKGGVVTKDIGHFNRLRNLVDFIFIVSCKAAQKPIGWKMCGEIARRTGAWVMAGDVDQLTTSSEMQFIANPDLHVIDDFEGRVYAFDKNGFGFPISTLNGRGDQKIQDYFQMKEKAQQELLKNRK